MWFNNLPERHGRPFGMSTGVTKYVFCEQERVKMNTVDANVFIQHCKRKVIIKTALIYCDESLIHTVGVQSTSQNEIQ